MSYKPMDDLLGSANSKSPLKMNTPVSSSYDTIISGSVLPKVSPKGTGISFPKLIVLEEEGHWNTLLGYWVIFYALPFVLARLIMLGKIWPFPALRAIHCVLELGDFCCCGL